mmetsp:Transcript_10052/g.894  ORF Transcript_10052/g.894 Transcript_10052/m.894 type:complete len:89 (+) Transcript_10052:494-760(+)
MMKNGEYAISLDGSTIFKIYPGLLNSYNLTIYLNLLSLVNLKLVLKEKLKKKKKSVLKLPLNKTKNNNNKNLPLLLNKKELQMLNKLN